MDEPIRHVFQIKVLAARPQITFVVPVSLKVAIDSGHESIAPDIKLATLVEKWLFDVLLNDVASLLAVYIGVGYDFLDLLELPAHLDTAAPVCVLSRLHYPNGLA
jgi:hypothetical protein